MLMLVLLAAMVVEITVLVLVGQAIGVLPTILLMILATVVGVALLRREGARTMLALSTKMRAGQQPRTEMTDGLLIAVAGVLIIVPGFVSDVVALTLLFPPTRALIRKRMGRRRRAESGPFVVDSVVVDPVVVRPAAVNPGPDRVTDAAADPVVVDSVVVDSVVVDPDDGSRRRKPQ